MGKGGCEKDAHQPKLKRMDLETWDTAGSKALMMVLQDGVSGGQAHLESLHRASNPSTKVPPPVSPRLSTMGWTVFPDLSSVCPRPLHGLAPPWRLVSSCPACLFPFLCFEFTNRMNPSENSRHPALPLLARTFQFCKSYGYQLLHQRTVTQS